MRFSFLLPTRGRIASLSRFLESVLDTAQHPEDVEVVLCVDEDDPESHHVTVDGLSIKTVIVAPGASMGALNRAAFDASTGCFVMLINDDVVARTKCWDRAVYAAFQSLGDDVGLIHTNDLLFRERLCTFPILSRAACLEVGVCPTEYRRYRIDDHIYDTYNLLAHLGHRRILYLTDVVFEHLNFVQQGPVDGAEVFRSEDAKVYRPNQEILRVDADIFANTSDDRKHDARRLAALIDRAAAARCADEYERRLSAVTDLVSYRRSAFVRPFPTSSVNALDQCTVTVAVVTGGLERAHARECLTRIKKHSAGADIVVLDNNGSSTFNHPHEMNKMLAAARTDYLVLLDDDVLVEEGWLQGLLRAVDPEAALVASVHKDATGAISHAGVYLAGDNWATHTHLTDVPATPRTAQCVCSACILIDLKKCGHLRFDEAYRKYFLDLDFSFKVWEAGYKVVCSPYSVVTHLAGATIGHGSQVSLELWEKDLLTFQKDWITSGRLDRVQQKMLIRYPFLLLLYALPREITFVLERDSWEVTQFERDVVRLIDSTVPFPLFRSLLLSKLKDCAERSRARGDTMKEQCCRRAVESLAGVLPLVSGPVPILAESHQSHNIVRYNGAYFVVPHALGPVDLRTAEAHHRREILMAATLEQARTWIPDEQVTAKPPVQTPEIAPAVPLPMEPPRLVVEGYKHFNIVYWNGRAYAVPQGEGEFDPGRVERGDYSRSFAADSVPEVQARVDGDGMLLLRRAARSLKRRLATARTW